MLSSDWSAIIELWRMNFISRLTDNARTSLQHANAIARGYGSSYIGTEHILLGVLAQGASVGAKLLADANVTLDRAEVALNLTPRAVVTGTGVMALSETAKLTLKMAWDMAQEFHQDFLGTEHIIYSMLSQKSARATVLLHDMNVDVVDLGVPVLSMHAPFEIVSKTDVYMAYRAFFTFFDTKD